MAPYLLLSLAVKGLFPQPFLVLLCPANTLFHLNLAIPHSPSHLVLIMPPLNNAFVFFVTPILIIFQNPERYHLCKPLTKKF